MSFLLFLAIGTNVDALADVESGIGNILALYLCKKELFWLFVGSFCKVLLLLTKGRERGIQNEMDEGEGE